MLTDILIIWKRAAADPHRYITKKLLIRPKNLNAMILL